MEKCEIFHELFSRPYYERKVEFHKELDVSGRFEGLISDRMLISLVSKTESSWFGKLCQ